MGKVQGEFMKRLRLPSESGEYLRFEDLSCHGWSTLRICYQDHHLLLYSLEPKRNSLHDRYPVPVAGKYDDASSLHLTYAHDRPSLALCSSIQLPGTPLSAADNPQGTGIQNIDE